jgi:hypothetical protein
MARFLSISMVYFLLSFFYYVIVMPELVIMLLPNYSILCTLLIWSNLSLDNFIELFLLFSLILLMIFHLSTSSNFLNLLFAAIGSLIASLCVAIKAQLLLAHYLLRSNFKDCLSEVDPSNLLLRFFPEIKIQYKINDFKAGLKHMFEEHNYEYSTIKISVRESLLRNAKSMAELRERVESYIILDQTIPPIITPGYFQMMYSALTCPTAMKIYVAGSLLILSYSAYTIVSYGLAACASSFFPNLFPNQATLDLVKQKITEQNDRLNTIEKNQHELKEIQGNYTMQQNAVNDEVTQILEPYKRIYKEGKLDSIKPEDIDSRVLSLTKNLREEIASLSRNNLNDNLNLIKEIESKTIVNLNFIKEHNTTLKELNKGMVEVTHFCGQACSYAQTFLKKKGYSSEQVDKMSTDELLEKIFDIILTVV